MNGRAACSIFLCRLPHIGIAGDAADRAADGHFTAIRVDRAAVYVLNFRAGLHLKVGTLQPDRAGRAFRRIRFVSVASAGRDDRRVILDHAAGLHHQLGFASGAHSRHTAEVPQHRASAQRDRAGNGCVGGDDGVLHIIGIMAGISGARAVIADSLSKHRALFLAAIIKDDVRQGQTGAHVAGGLNLDHGGVVGTAGVVLLLSKVIAACNGVSRITKAGNRE